VVLSSGASWSAAPTLPSPTSRSAPTVRPRRRSEDEKEAPSRACPGGEGGGGETWDAGDHRSNNIGGWVPTGDPVKGERCHKQMKEAKVICEGHSCMAVSPKMTHGLFVLLELMVSSVISERNRSP
jgi:hypothetical protein